MEANGMDARLDGRPRDGSVLDTVGAVWHRRKRLALVVFTLSFAAVAGLVWPLPDIYRASATVLVNQEEQSGRFLTSPGSGQLEPRLQMIGQKILSRARLMDLIRRFDLYGELRETATSEEAVIERARRDIRIERNEVDRQWGQRATISFALSYQGWDPQTAADVTNALARMYVEENEQIRQQEARNITVLVKEQLEEVKQKLVAQEQRINDFKDRHIGELPEQQDVNLSTLRRFNTELELNNENQLRLIDRRDRLVEQMAGYGDSGSAGGPETPEARLLRLKRELAELSTRYSEKYPDVIRLKAEIALAERQIMEEQSNSANRAVASRAEKLRQVKEELEALKKEEQRLRDTVARYQQRIENVPKREQELQRLMRDYGAIKELYGNLLSRHEEARLAEILERQRGAQFRILDAAVPPVAPVGPKRLRLVLMGFIFCLAMTAGLILLLEQLDDSFHESSELRAFSKVPVLVTIPRIDTRGDIWRRRLKACFATLAFAAGLALVVHGSYLLGSGNQQIVWMLQRGA